MIRHDEENRTFDCEPTLTDTQVLKFCREGFLMLEGIVPDEINRRTFAYLDEHPSKGPSTIILEDWFRDNVLLEPASSWCGEIHTRQRCRAAGTHEQPPRAVPCTAGGLASRRGFAFWPRGQLSPGILLSAGCSRGDGANRGAAGLAFAGNTARRRTPRRRVNDRTCGLGLHHDLLTLAP